MYGGYDGHIAEDGTARQEETGKAQKEVYRCHCFHRSYGHINWSLLNWCMST